jgi:hypothetical protein
VQQLEQLFLAAAQAEHRIFAGGGRAIRIELAAVRRAAVHADGNLRLVETRERPARVGDELRDAGEPFLHALGNVGLDEQPFIAAVAAVDELGVQGRDGDLSQAQAVLRQRPCLDRAVVEVVILDARRRFDLDELELGLAAVEHVDTGADAVVIERCLEDRLAATGGEQRARRIDRSSQATLEAHHMAGAPAIELPRQLADDVAGGE